MTDYKSYDDQHLLTLLKQGKHAAFAEIYNRYWKKLYALAANKLDDFSEAEDVVQQLFVSIWERREELEVVTTLGSYLAVAVKYRVYKALARISRTMHYGDDQANEAALDVLDDSTQQWLEFNEVKQRLSMLVDSLPEKCRLVYQLSREQGLSQKQVAEELDISEKTVKNHMNRAYKTLKTGLRSFFISL
nr:RNA polymerase sigma-70 factor [Pedobacter panaciterrae]